MIDINVRFRPKQWILRPNENQSTIHSCIELAPKCTEPFNKKHFIVNFDIYHSVIFDFGCRRMSICSFNMKVSDLYMYIIRKWRMVNAWYICDSVLHLYNTLYSWFIEVFATHSGFKLSKLYWDTLEPRLLTYFGNQTFS